MKILALSDIQSDSRNIFSLIGSVLPNMVLLAGDLVDKIWKHRSSWKRLRSLLMLLDDLSLPTYIVRGNHDIYPHFDWLMSFPYKRVESLDLKNKITKPISIIGVPHNFSDDLTKIRTLETDPPPLVDIVISHTESKRRPWLFYIPAKIILTGHFDQQLSVINNRVFISMSSFPSQYTIINYQSRNNFHIEYFDNSYHGLSIREIEYRNGRFSSKNLFDSSNHYASQVECLIKQRSLLREGLTTRKEAQDKLDKLGVSPNHYREVLACID